MHPELVDDFARLAYTRSMTIPIDPQTMAAYRHGAAQREERKRLANQQRRQAAWSVARQAAAVLKEQFGASRVVVFGSLVHGLWYGPHSDIDLAAEGISPGEFWRAWCAIDRIDPAYEVDMIALESATPSLRAAIEQEGLAL